MNMIIKFKIPERWDEICNATLFPYWSVLSKCPHAGFTDSKNQNIEWRERHDMSGEITWREENVKENAVNYIKERWWEIIDIISSDIDS